MCSLTLGAIQQSRQHSSLTAQIIEAFGGVDEFRPSMRQVPIGESESARMVRALFAQPDYFQRVYGISLEENRILAAAYPFSHRYDTILRESALNSFGAGRLPTISGVSGLPARSCLKRINAARMGSPGTSSESR